MLLLVVVVVVLVLDVVSVNNDVVVVVVVVDVVAVARPVVAVVVVVVVRFFFKTCLLLFSFGTGHLPSDKACTVSFFFFLPLDLSLISFFCLFVCLFRPCLLYDKLRVWSLDSSDPAIVVDRSCDLIEEARKDRTRSRGFMLMLVSPFFF